MRRFVTNTWVLSKDIFRQVVVEYLIESVTDHTLYKPVVESIKPVTLSELLSHHIKNYNGWGGAWDNSGEGEVRGVRALQA